MTDQPNHTPIAIITSSSIENAEDATPALLVHTAQQAVLPRRLDDGIYAILDADGAVQIVETPGHQAVREQDWAERYADRPRVIKRNVTVFDVASFLDYLDRHQGGIEGGYLLGTGSLEVWADIDQRTITATLDGIDGWRRNSATLRLSLSREWVEWAGIDGKMLGQVEMAEFIESHLSTIAFPDGASLLDVCQTLQVHTSAQFKQSNILATGQRVFRFEEQLEAKAGQKGDLTIPGELTLALRPFQGSDPVSVVARFRFQVREGVLRLGIKLAEPDKALEDAFDGVVAEVQAGVPVHINHGRA